MYVDLAEVPPISNVVKCFCFFSLYKDISLIEFNSTSLYARFFNTSLSKQSAALSDIEERRVSVCSLCVCNLRVHAKREQEAHITTYHRVYFIYNICLFLKKTTTNSYLNFRLNKTRATRLLSHSSVHSSCWETLQERKKLSINCKKI